MQISLLGGAYSARSVIANAQRCINYFPEANRADAPAPYTFYQRPGRRLLTSPAAAGQGRGLYRASDGQLFAIVGQNVYYINTGFVFVLLGVLATALTSQIAIADNGTDVVLVDGSAIGYTISLASHAFAQIVDPTGAFTGSTQIEFIDTFLVYNYPGTRFWGSTLSNTVTFDALYIAGKDGYPDPLVAMNVNRREILLFGELKTEFWYNAGGAAYPFAVLPGAYIEHGCLAPFSVAAYDMETYWLAQDLAGNCMVLRVSGYDVTRISNHALEYALQQMKIAGADLSDALGFVWQQNGHIFYSLNFVSGNQTWVFDSSLGGTPDLAWHQESWQNPMGGAERMRDGAMAFAYGQNLSLDHTTGDLYALDQNLYVDQVAGTDCPIVCVKGFPHLVQGVSKVHGQPEPTDGHRTKVDNVRLDFDSGLAIDPGSVVGLRWSVDRGHTFGATILQPSGNPGEYLTQPLWTQLGIGRDLVLEVIHQINGPAALQGAWADINVLGT